MRALLLTLLLAPAAVFALTKEIGPGANVEAEIAALNPGDELVLRGGAYTLPTERFTIDKLATQALPIIIRSKTGERAVLHRPDANQNIIDFIHADWLVLRNLTFTGGSAGLRFLAGHDVTLEGCEISGTADVALRANDTGVTYERFQVLRNEIHHTNGTGEGMYLGCNSGGCQFNNALIEGNHVHHTDGPGVSQGDGIEIKEGSGGNVIRDNVIHDTNYPCILVYATMGRPQNTIERNLLFRCGDHGIQAARDAIIRNNIILSAGSDGIAMQPHQSGAPGNLLVVHNTVLKATNAALSVRGPTASVVVANNALYSQAGTAFFGNGTLSFVTFTGNVGVGSVAGGTLAPGVLANDFVQASYAGGVPMNPFPKVGSALGSAGTAMYVAADDFNGTARGGVADVGAYRAAGGVNPGWVLAEDFKGAVAQPPVDAGVPDAGATGGGAGGGGGSAATGGGTGGGEGADGGTGGGGGSEPQGCSCSSGGGALLLGLGLLAALRRRR